MLLFKKKFLPAIRAGEKTQTIRLWKFRHTREASAVTFLASGHIQITAIEPVEIDALTDADAIPDGFESASAATARAAHDLRRQDRGRLQSVPHRLPVALRKAKPQAADLRYCGYIPPLAV